MGHLEDLLRQQAEFKTYPKILDMGDWIGVECQEGFYEIYYQADNPLDLMIDGTGSSVTYTFAAPYDIKFNRVLIAKPDAASSYDIELRHFPSKFDGTHFATLYKNAEVTARDINVELGSAYEGRAGAKIQLVMNATSAENVAFCIFAKFLESIEV